MANQTFHMENGHQNLSFGKLTVLEIFLGKFRDFSLLQCPGLKPAANRFDIRGAQLIAARGHYPSGHLAKQQALCCRAGHDGRARLPSFQGAVPGPQVQTPLPLGIPMAGQTVGLKDGKNLRFKARKFFAGLLCCRRIQGEERSRCKKNQSNVQWLRVSRSHLAYWHFSLAYGQETGAD